MLNIVTIMIFMVFACITLIDWQIMPVGSSVSLLILLSSILIIIKPFTRGFLKKQRMPCVVSWQRMACPNSQYSTTPWFVQALETDKFVMIYHNFKLHYWKFFLKYECLSFGQGVKVELKVFCSQ